MGSDLFFYKVLSKNGKIIKIHYTSTQECGLANETKGFWVTAVCESDTGAYEFKFGLGQSNYIPNCPLTAHSYWKEIPFEYYPAVRIENVRQDVSKEIREKIRSFGSFSVMGGSGSHYHVKYRKAESANACLNELNGSPDFAEEGKVLEVKPSGLDVPINHYDLPESCFQQWISSIKLDEIISQGSETEAIYTLEFTDEKWIEHLSEGMEWAGR